MADIIDQTAEREDKLLELRIQAARQAPGDIKGPVTCKCGGPNDRAEQGFCVCSSCMLEMAK